MANKKMLIDATHEEETRVVVISGNRLEDFDVEVASRRQLKSNVYLAKVVTVEPSLQAAFVEYGGLRHGFLAFNEIHPDYYQIPVADREALLAEEEVASADDDESKTAGGEPEVETVGGDESEEVAARRPAKWSRHYRIQEVIKRRQVILVQVVKEERGNKGAALTTYLSLAGRYCVLMPNTARGGGISRKITNPADRKRLKTMVGDLKIPPGVAVIVRTAGSDRSKAEIKRDYDYLLRLWETIRETTLESTAPTLIHEEGSLIKRSIRDLYDRDIDEVIVDGDEGYRVAKEFMKLLIPSHARRVQRYPEDEVSLFHRYKVENQMEAMHSPVVQLRSGGYIVINPTEALVSVDVNSGRATRERNIEETALKTNLEAADEVARQLRLRDLAGLIVIDFIDMEVGRNNAKVERRLKDGMRVDRARIQLGRISPFGLLEMSRQRLRPSLLETSFEPCPFCHGTGVRRSTESMALHVLRGIEENGITKGGGDVTVRVPVVVALYVLNQKRAALVDIERRYGLSVLLEGDDGLVPPEYHIERPKGDAGRAERAAPRARAEAKEDADKPGKRRQRSRRRRKDAEEEPQAVTDVRADDAAEDGGDEAAAAGDAEAAERDPAAEHDPAAERDPATKRRRRGKRGGRRRTRPGETAEVETAEAAAEAAAADESTEASPDVGADEAAETAPRPRTRRRRPARPRKARGNGGAENQTAAPTAAGDAAESEPVAGAAPEGEAEAAPLAEAAPEPEPGPTPLAETAPEPEPGPAPDAEAAPEPVSEPKAPRAPGPGPADLPVFPEPPADDDAHSDMGKTTTINVGADSAPGDKQSRRGWWQRMTE